MIDDGYTNSDFKTCSVKFEQYLKESTAFPITQLELKKDDDNHYKVYHNQKLIHEFDLTRIDNTHAGIRAIALFVSEKR